MCSQHNAALEVKPAVKACRDLATLRTVWNSLVTAGQWARWCVRDKTQCVVDERFCGRCSDLQLIVYRLLVRLSL